VRNGPAKVFLGRINIMMFAKLPQIPCDLCAGSAEKFDLSMHCKDALTAIMLTLNVKALFNEESLCIRETKPSQEQRERRKIPSRRLDLRTSFAADPHWTPTQSIASGPHDQNDERG